MTQSELRELKAIGAELGAAKAEIEVLREQVKVLQSDANSWQSGYDKGRNDGGKHRKSEVEQLRQHKNEYMDAAEVTRKALLAENEKLREALRWYEEKVTECRKIGSLGDNARQALDLDGGFRARDALSQQPEPTDTFTAVDMATAAAQGFRDGQAAVEQAVAQDERETFEQAFVIQEGVYWSEDHQSYRSMNGRAIEDRDAIDATMWWAGWKARAALARPAQTEQQPILAVKVEADCVEHVHPEYGGGYFFTEDAIVEMYAAPIAQTAPQPVSSALADLAGDRFEAPVAGWSGPAQDERETVEVEAYLIRNKEVPALRGVRLFVDPSCYDKNSETLPLMTVSQHERIVAALIAHTAPQPEQSGLYTCIGKGGSYELIGRATTAGVLKVTGRFADEVIVYRDTESNALYCREPGDFRLRMARADMSAKGAGKFRMGDLVKKSTGSEWVGRVVGWYSTEQTKEGYAVESSAHRNSVQIYPAKALELVPMAAKEESL